MVQDQREWAREPKKSLAERRAEELEVICDTLPAVQSSEDSRERIRTLCSLTAGTDSLKAYVQELLETSTLGGFPHLLRVRIEKKQYGIFDLSIAQEFERLQILIKQPAEMEKALRSGDKIRAEKLRLRIEQWKKEFERLYEEPVSRGVNIEEVAQQIKRLNEPVEKEE